ncbi:MAG: ABC transporter permease subunit [Phycisphaerales bacterium]|nr:ABC transporter permease subunit [Phycisphaerales bacterium]
MLEQFLAIARNTFVESIRQPIYLVMIAVGILALLITPGLSTFTLSDDNLFMVDMGLATIFLCGLVIAAFVATSVVTREIENKTVLALVSKPVGRPVFVVGKYVGVAAALLVAAVILSCAFLLIKRYGVMQTARDTGDPVVLTFGLLAVFVSVGVGLWCNFFYGWVFTSTAVGSLFPLSLLAWLAVLLFDREWNVQLLKASEETYNASFLSPSLQPEVLMALAGVLLALLVVASVALAASTRLSQVMTVVVCLVVFVIGLLTDTLFGRRAFESNARGRIVEINVIDDHDDDFSDDGDAYHVIFDRGIDLADGMEVYLSSDNVGFGLLGPGKARLENVSYSSARLVRVGAEPMERPPQVDDYIIDGPQRIHAPWRIVWSIPPNLQALSFSDALSQEHFIPPRHLGLVALYSALYISGMIALAVMLFQTREVG